MSKGKNMLKKCVQHFFSANDINALFALLAALVSNLDELRNFLEEGWNQTEAVAILYDYMNTVTKFLQLFGTNALTQFFTQTLTYVFLAIEKYLRVVDTIQDNEILINYNQFIESGKKLILQLLVLLFEGKNAPYVIKV